MTPLAPITPDGKADAGVGGGDGGAAPPSVRPPFAGGRRSIHTRRAAPGAALLHPLQLVSNPCLRPLVLSCEFLMANRYAGEWRQRRRHGCANWPVTYASGGVAGELRLLSPAASPARLQPLCLRLLIASARVCATVGRAEGPG